MDGLRSVAGGLKAVIPAVLVVGLLLTGCGSADGETAATTSTTGPMVVPIADETCLACHDDFDTVTAGEDKKVFSHALHTGQLIGCSTCHQVVGHTGEPVPPTQVCDDCHGMEMPHPEDFETSHGALVDEQGGDVCARCHNVYLHCQACHGIQMPHPEQWTAKHGDIAYPQMQVCSRCHDDAFCLSCHPVAMPHGEDWTRSHGPVVVDQGSQVCVDCHEPTLCVSCHGMQMPHPADWGTTHPAMAEEKPGECVLCHDGADCKTCHEIHATHGKGSGS